MLPVSNSQKGSDGKRLSAIFNRLNAADKQALLRFAEYLEHVSEPEEKLPLAEPVLIERPENESVVKAIKRLTASYPMIEKEKLLHQTSDLMAAHLINGKTASEVIDQLESVFADHYQQLKASSEQS